MKLSDEIVGTGLVRQYLDFVQEHEAPPSFHLMSLVALFGVVLERRLVISRGYTTRGNVYLLLLGPPASRKTYATRIIRDVFRGAGHEIEVVGENATDEGLLRHMQRKELKGESPHATVVAEEFGTLLGKKKYQEGLAQWLCRAYDGGPLRNPRAGESYGTSDSFLTILAGTTPRALRGISSLVIDTGLASRLWVVQEKKKDKWVSRPKFDKVARQRLTDAMEARIAPLLALPQIIFDPGERAEKVFEEWYMGPHRRAAERAQEEAESWFGRRHDHAMKMAVLLHLLDDGDVRGMDEAAVRRGIALVEAMEPGMFEAYAMLGQTEWGSAWEKMVELIRRRPGIELRHLMAAASKWVDGPGKAQKAAEEMRQSGILRCEGEGGSTKLWIAEEDDDQPEGTEVVQDVRDDAGMPEVRDLREGVGDVHGVGRGGGDPVQMRAPAQRDGDNELGDLPGGGDEGGGD